MEAMMCFHVGWGLTIYWGKSTMGSKLPVRIADGAEAEMGGLAVEGPTIVNAKENEPRAYKRRRKRSEKSRGLPGRIDSRPDVVRTYSSSARFWMLSEASHVFAR